VLATGHSSRALMQELAAAGVSLLAKPFAMGFRVEHPQVPAACTTIRSESCFRRERASDELVDAAHYSPRSRPFLMQELINKLQYGAASAASVQRGKGMQSLNSPSDCSL
jgi:hypothetical protein